MRSRPVMGAADMAGGADNCRDGAGAAADAVGVRPETPADLPEIAALTTRAFASAAHASGQEAAIVASLRARQALALSLVAERSGSIIGHAAFSPAPQETEQGKWFALGPLSVEPAEQRRGVGSLLVRTDMDLLAKAGAAGCILLGDPAYYRRFGFEVQPRLAPPGCPPDYFMVRPFADRLPLPGIRFHPGFDVAASETGT